MIETSEASGKMGQAEQADIRPPLEEPGCAPVLSRWLLTLLLFGLAGWLLGVGLDAVLYEVSHDYVYPPGYCQRRSFYWTLVPGTFVAALLTQCSGSARISLLRWVGTFAGSAAAVAIVSLLSGVAHAALIKAFGAGTLEQTLLPTPRLAFCTGLIRGAAAGALLGSGGFALMIVRAGRRLRSDAGDLH